MEDTTIARMMRFQEVEQVQQAVVLEALTWKRWIRSGQQLEGALFETCQQV